MTPKKGERLFNPEYAQQLIDIAFQDLESAKGLSQLNQGRKENIVFLSQQAIEKTLKAVLCHLGIPVPLVHDLGVFVAKLPDKVEAPYGYELARYNDYAGLLRYERGYTELSREDIESSLCVAEEVLQWAEKIIKT